MENINISFEENENVLSATKCESDCSSIMFDKYICSLKKAWNEAGFSIIEERFSENVECFHVGFLAHFFRLRKE